VQPGCTTWEIGIPDDILLVPRKLTTEEFEVVKTHTVIGARILSGSRLPLLSMAEESLGHTRRGGTLILERAALRDEACECYDLIRQEYARLLPGEPDRVGEPRAATVGST
jgi:hypothetical protein